MRKLLLILFISFCFAPIAAQSKDTCKSVGIIPVANWPLLKDRMKVGMVRLMLLPGKQFEGRFQIDLQPLIFKGEEILSFRAKGDFTFTATDRAYSLRGKFDGAFDGKNSKAVLSSVITLTQNGKEDEVINHGIIGERILSLPFTFPSMPKKELKGEGAVEIEWETTRGKFQIRQVLDLQPLCAAVKLKPTEFILERPKGRQFIGDDVVHLVFRGANLLPGSTFVAEFPASVQYLPHSLSVNGKWIPERHVVRDRHKIQTIIGDSEDAQLELDVLLASDQVEYPVAGKVVLDGFETFSNEIRLSATRCHLLGIDVRYELSENGTKQRLWIWNHGPDVVAKNTRLELEIIDRNGFGYTTISLPQLDRGEVKEFMMTGNKHFTGNYQLNHPTVKTWCDPDRIASDPNRFFLLRR